IGGRPRRVEVTGHYPVGPLRDTTGSAEAAGRMRGGRLSGMATTTGTGLAEAMAVADAILYEGYLLYPYRHSSGKNRVRWQFGVLVPAGWGRAHGLGGGGLSGAEESWWQQTECLMEGGDSVDIRLRFLHVQTREAEGSAADL